MKKNHWIINTLVSLNPYLTVVCLIFILSACGVKSPPVATKSKKPVAIEKIGYKIEGSILKLNWNQSSSEGDVVAYLVYRSKESTVDEPCDECPLTFTKVSEKPRGVNLYEEKIETGFRYVYKVLARSRGGKVSDNSELIRFVY